MSFSIHGRFREQVRFLRRQFLQDGELPFKDVLSESAVAQALKALDVVWLDRIYSPLVTLWVAESVQNLRERRPLLRFLRQHSLCQVAQIVFFSVPPITNQRRVLIPHGFHEP